MTTIVLDLNSTHRVTAQKKTVSSQVDSQSHCQLEIVLLATTSLESVMSHECQLACGGKASCNEATAGSWWRV